jgi:hypothetical protein
MNAVFRNEKIESFTVMDTFNWATLWCFSYFDSHLNIKDRRKLIPITIRDVQININLLRKSLFSFLSLFPRSFLRFSSGKRSPNPIPRIITLKINEMSNQTSFSHLGVAKFSQKISVGAGEC